MKTLDSLLTSPSQGWGANFRFGQFPSRPLLPLTTGWGGLVLGAVLLLQFTLRAQPERVHLALPGERRGGADASRCVAVPGNRVRVAGDASLSLQVSKVATGPAEPLETWEWRNPLPQGNDIHGLAYDPLSDRLVAVGDYGTLLTSKNGHEWTTRSLETNAVLYGVAHGNGRWVAVGSACDDDDKWTGEDVIFTSATGAEWEQHSTGGTSYLHCVTWGNGQFVAAGYGQFGIPDEEARRIFTSPDGVKWTPQVLQSNRQVYGVAGGEPGFVASSGKTLHYSPNGVEWQSFPSPSNCWTHTVTYVNSRFVACGSFDEDPSICPAVTLVSTNGRDWVLGPPLPTPDTGCIEVFRIGYGNGRFVAVGNMYSGWGLCWVSADGLEWALQAEILPLEWPWALVWTGHEFVAGGRFGALAFSTDGEHWTAVTRATSNNLRAAAYGNGRFVAVGNTGISLTSPDGIHWASQPPVLVPPEGSAPNLHDLVSADGRFVVVGESGLIATSSDGSKWTQQASGTREDLFDVAWGNGVFVAVGGDEFGVDHQRYHALLTSSDGTNWTTRFAGGGRESFRLHGVCFGNGQFVAVGGGSGDCLTSIDGVAWVRQTNGWGYMKGVVYGNGRFVAVGEGPSAWVSTGATNWEEHLIAKGAWEADDVEFADGVFVVVGDNGRIYTSTDGLTWVRRHSPTSTNLRGLAFGQGTFLIVGNNDTILQSPPVGICLGGQVQAGGFELTLIGAAGRACRIEASPNLSDWTSLATLTNVASGTRWLDRESPSRRFYRTVFP